MSSFECAVKKSLDTIVRKFVSILKSETPAVPEDFETILYRLSTVTSIPPFTNYTTPHTESSLGKEESASLLAIIFTDFQLPGGKIRAKFASRLLFPGTLFVSMKFTILMGETIYRYLYISGNFCVECEGELLLVDNLQITSRIPV